MVLAIVRLTFISIPTKSIFFGRFPPNLVYFLGLIMRNRAKRSGNISLGRIRRHQSVASHEDKIASEEWRRSNETIL